MSRRANADSSATYEHILDSARRILKRCNGNVSNLSFRTLANEAKLSHGTIRYYFQTREALVEALLEAHYADLNRVADAAEAALNHAPDAAIPGVLRRIVTQLYCHCAQSSDVTLRMSIPSETRLHYVTHYFARMVPPISRRSGATPTAVRLVFHSVMFALVRYATLEDAERLLVTQAASAEEAHALVTRHLGDLALGGLGHETSALETHSPG